jgi:DNA-directed RNA polymerase subunit alpha
MEDTTDLILNLKRIPLKMHVEHPKTLYLKTSESGEVKASHITPDPDVDILDPDAYVATLSHGTTLSVELRVKQGRGYVSADKNFDEDLSIGWIPVDSVHSPIKKVNYFVEAARVGQATDYERLALEVWGNGAVTPRDAVGLAAKLMRDHLTIFVNVEDDEALAEPTLASDQEREAWMERLAKSVDEMELSVRSYNCLKNANIRTIGELVQKSEAEMLKTKNFGRKSLNEIKEILAGMGLSLGMKLDNYPPPAAPSE